ncbi:glycosyltransferase [Nocardia yamanashiensis]|uniref:glycosyltransferase n=1 Tax=Nocardia yamanashiensis TaxID=209247 RepID=UPI001E492CCD|nr:glycosyltransferase [Nocardia yamanashiensis]UGT42768.1 glycosyltransferase [Nocardia yamanashiensis]
MRVLLSTFGSRGEVQPTLAVGVELLALGARVRMCAPPDFRALVEGYGVEFVPVGSELSGVGRKKGTATEADRRASIDGMIDTHFATLGPAAEGCEVLLGCGALQIAAQSIAELRGMRYIYAAFAANTLPSEQIPPPPLGPGVDAEADVRTQWEQDAVRWNLLWRDSLNRHREALGLAAVDEVRDYIFTDHPWLAADPLLSPWPDSKLEVWQPGAWLLRDTRPLAPELEEFLTAGDPPVYFGFGSMHVGADTARNALAAARTLGYRAIVLRGWAGLELDEAGPDCLVVGEVNHRALFPRTAAVVHHGGAGTTAAVAASGTPQVVVPQMFDQYYWAAQVERLGVGVAHAPGQPSAESLTAALSRALTPQIGSAARTLGPRIRIDGAARAAHEVLATERV